MITTSDKYKTAISKSGRHFRLKIDIAGTAYTGIKSFKLKGGTNSSEQITFGEIGRASCRERVFRAV